MAKFRETKKGFSINAVKSCVLDLSGILIRLGEWSV